MVYSNKIDGLYDNKLIIFPPKLMNSSNSPELLSEEFARYIENMQPSNYKSGVGAKRFGVNKYANLPDSLSKETITQIIEFKNNQGLSEIIICSSLGKIYRYNIDGNNFTILYTGLDPKGVINYCIFAKRLIIVNGIDKPCYYDGNKITIISQFLKDNFSQANFINNQNLKIINSSIKNKYEVNNYIRIRYQGKIEEQLAKIIQINQDAGDNVILNLEKRNYPLSETIQTIEYQISPPAFSDVYSHNDRLWALSEGNSSTKDLRGNNGLYIYYTGYANNFSSWYNETTCDLNYINMEDKHGCFDEFVKITAIDNLMLFIGKNKTQIWSGSDPDKIGNFVWNKTLNIGCINGKLLQERPQNIIFVSNSGVTSIAKSNYNDSYQINENLASNINDLILESLKSIRLDIEQYKNCLSWFYPIDNFLGFKIGDRTFIGFLSNNQINWVLWSGIFNDISAINYLSDGRLIMAKDNNIYAYANDTDIKYGKNYSDDNIAIKTKWWSQWFKFKNRWNNHFYQLLVDNCYRAKGSLTCYLDHKTDNLRKFNFDLNTRSVYWDESYFDHDFFKQDDVINTIKDKFSCHNFSFLIETEDSEGEFSILGFKLIGN